MKVYTLITSYVQYAANDLEPPLINVQYITSEREKARACYEACVAREIADGWEALSRYGAEQVTLGRGDERLTVKLHFSTRPMEFAIGDANW